MNIEISEATLDNQPILANLMELYLYDFSEIVGDDCSDNGLFGYPPLDLYWLVTGRHAFLVRVDSRLAGFVLVKEGSLYLDNPADNDIPMQVAEYFILRKYRRQGLGTQVAWKIFDRFPGRWEIAEIVENTSAQVFWRKIIGQYTNGQFSELLLNNEHWHGPVQIFENRKPNNL